MSQPAPEQKIVRRKLADEILDRLLEMIERGEIEAGGYLPSERDLMQRYGVGRPAVREALQSLAGMGIIQIQHGERARLVSLAPANLFDQIDRAVRLLLQTSPETRDHLREARLMFESGMVRLAARNAKPSNIAALRQALDSQIAARGTPAAFVAADMGFHNAIAALAGNPIFTAVSQAMLQWVSGMFPGLVRVPGTEDLTLREHEAILAAIAANDEQRAVKALSAHLLRTHPLYKLKHDRGQ